MIKEISLDSYMESDIDATRNIIKDARGQSRGTVRVGRNFYSTVIDELSNGTRNTPAQVEYFKAFETAATVFRAASLELRKNMDVMTLEHKLGALKTVNGKGNSSEADNLQKQITDAIFFSNRYALYFAGHVGLALLNSDKADVKAQVTFGTKGDASKNRDELTGMLAKVTTDNLLTILEEKRQKLESVSDDDLKYSLEATFTYWINQFNFNTFRDTVERHDIKNLKIKYGNFSMNNGEFKRKYDTVVIDDKIMIATKEDVVGAEDFCKALWGNFVKLGAYNLERKVNPYDPASVIFVYGEPGGGKTFTAHAYMRSFSELCKEKGVPLWILTHSTTDYASHYQNQTANQLNELAGKIKAFPGPVIMYVADADNIFQSRKDPRLTAEQQQTLAVYFKMFDGTSIPKNGKFMAIMDANYIDGIDDATKSRLFDEVVELKRFEKPEHFAELVRRSLTKGSDGIKLSGDEWLEVGKYVLESPLSNREVGHVVRQLRRGFEVDENMIGAPYEVHIDYRNKQLEIVTRDYIINSFDGYVKNRAKIEAASLRAKMEDDRMRFLQHLEREAPSAADTK